MSEEILIFRRSANMDPDPTTRIRNPDPIFGRSLVERPLTQNCTVRPTVKGLDMPRVPSPKIFF